MESGERREGHWHAGPHSNSRHRDAPQPRPDADGAKSGLAIYSQGDARSPRPVFVGPAPRRGWFGRLLRWFRHGDAR
jgi:hypothetical protein